MKKRFLTVLACSALVFILSGCNLGLFHTEKEFNINCADIFTENGIKEDENINAGRSRDIFVESMTAALKNENLTIGMNFITNYGKDEKMVNDIQLKIDAQNKLGSLKALYNENGVETNGKSYYSDGYLYTDFNDVKTKMEMTYSDFLVENDGYTYAFESNMVKKFACVENGKSKIYLLEFDPIQYENNVIQNAEASGTPLGEDESIIVNYSNIMFEVDENNVMRSYRQVISSQHKLGEETSDSLSDINVTFGDFGSTEIDVLEDLASYSEVSEIAEEITEQ